MGNFLKLNSVGEFNALIGQPTYHPMVSVVDLNGYVPQQVPMMNFNLYCILLKGSKFCEVRYGRKYYDYQDDTLLFIAPGQVVGSGEAIEEEEPSGHLLVFHPDLVKGTPLAKRIGNYTFFAYQSDEALHISEMEKKIVLDCLEKISYELKQGIDKHSKTLIVSYIELLLNYCVRFYDRQFITRDHVNKGILERFETLLNEYFASDKPQTIGLPSVGYCAGELCLSANYFGDLIKKETGKTAQEYIQYKLIDVAKERIFDKERSISEIAYDLGFKHLPSFTRLFRQKVGMTPNDYRTLP